MIATSACRIDSMREDGYRRLERLIYDHSLDAEARHLVDNEKSKCGRPDAPILIASLRRHAWVGVSGERTYYFIREDNPLAHPLGSRPARILREIPYNEITSRRFPLGERETAVARTKELVGADFKVQGIGPFVLATRSSHSSEQLQAIAAMLGVFRQFLIGTYEMAVPESLITVYLVPDSYELRRLAENIHGIRVTDLAIGYSYQDDLSVVGAIPGPVIGTLLHELFHLMVRADFGDVPAWLDEALASLYEVSKQSNGRFEGTENWRRKVLERFWDRRPTVRQLVSTRIFNLMFYIPTFQRPSASLFIGARAR